MERSVAEAVVDSMRRQGVRRLVVISVVGAGDSKGQAGFWYGYLLMPTFLRGAVRDKEAMEREVRESGVDFVLVRPPMLTDADATGTVRVVEGDEKAGKLARADLAEFLVEQLESDACLGRAVTVDNG